MEVAQNDHTNQSHKPITQMMTEDNMMPCPRMEMTNNDFGWSRASQVHMEELRLVNLTEICPI